MNTQKLSNDLIYNELKEYFDENRITIIHDLRLCYPYQIIVDSNIINNVVFAFYKNNFLYFYIYEDTEIDLKFYKVGEYLCYNIYALKYKDLDFNGNSQIIVTSY